MADDRPYGSFWWLTVAISSLSVVLSATPVFIIAAVSPFIRDEIPLTPRELGFAVSAYFVVSALASRPAAAAAHRHGPGPIMGAGAAIIGLNTLGMAFTSDLRVLLVLLALCGVGNGFSAPATNLALAELRDVGGDGLAFGLKQAALPVSTLLAGLAIPFIVVPFGWRYAIGSCAVGSVLYFLIPYRDRGPRPLPPAARDEARAQLRGVVLVAFGAGCASAAGTSMNAFFMETAVRIGLGAEPAGFLYAVAGLSGAVARVLLGLWVDRRPVPLARLFMALWVGGILAAGAFATATTIPVLLLATLLGYCLGWAWNGVFHLDVVRRYSQRAGVASGIVAVGIFLGGSIGPAVVGTVMEAGGPRPAWSVVAALFLCAVIAVAISGRIGGPVMADRTPTRPEGSSA